MSDAAWSPDGEWLAFVGRDVEVDEDVESNIYIIRVDGTELTQLTDEAYASRPHWATNWIIYLEADISSMGCGGTCTGEIMAIRPDGSAKTQVTEELYISSFAVAPE